MSKTNAEILESLEELFDKTSEARGNLNKQLEKITELKTELEDTPKGDKDKIKEIKKELSKEIKYARKSKKELNKELNEAVKLGDMFVNNINNELEEMSEKFDDMSNDEILKQVTKLQEDLGNDHLSRLPNVKGKVNEISGVLTKFENNVEKLSNDIEKHQNEIETKEAILKDRPFYKHYTKDSKNLRSAILNENKEIKREQEELDTLKKDLKNGLKDASNDNVGIKDLSELAKELDFRSNFVSRSQIVNIANEVSPDLLEAFNEAKKEGMAEVLEFAKNNDIEIISPSDEEVAKNDKEILKLKDRFENKFDKYVKNLSKEVKHMDSQDIEKAKESLDQLKELSGVSQIYQTKIENVEKILDDLAYSQDHNATKRDIKNVRNDLKEVANGKYERKYETTRNDHGVGEISSSRGRELAKNIEKLGDLQQKLDKANELTGLDLKERKETQKDIKKFEKEIKKIEKTIDKLSKDYALEIDNDLKYLENNLHKITKADIDKFTENFQKVAEVFEKIAGDADIKNPLAGKISGKMTAVAHHLQDAQEKIETYQKEKVEIEGDDKLSTRKKYLIFGSSEKSKALDALKQDLKEALSEARDGLSDLKGAYQAKVVGAPDINVFAEIIEEVAKIQNPAEALEAFNKILEEYGLSERETLSLQIDINAKRGLFYNVDAIEFSSEPIPERQVVNENLDPNTQNASEGVYMNLPIFSANVTDNNYDSVEVQPYEITYTTLPADKDALKEWMENAKKPENLEAAVKVDSYKIQYSKLPDVNEQLSESVKDVEAFIEEIVGLGASQEFVQAKKITEFAEGMRKEEVEDLVEGLQNAGVNVTVTSDGEFSVLPAPVVEQNSERDDLYFLSDAGKELHEEINQLIDKLYDKDYTPTMEEFNALVAEISEKYVDIITDIQQIARLMGDGFNDYQQGADIFIEEIATKILEGRKIVEEKLENASQYNTPKSMEEQAVEEAHRAVNGGVENISDTVSEVGSIQSIASTPSNGQSQGQSGAKPR